MIKTKVLIIGSGPAGFSAAIYTARAALEPTVICGMQPGGQLTITTDVENYPGFAKPVQGGELMEAMKAQALCVGANIVDDYVEKVELAGKPFRVFTALKQVYECNTLIICTGAEAKWLELESEQLFRGFGVSGCATCDGFFFKNKEVVVVGGGNTAVEEALFLTNHASTVYLLHRRSELRAEKILQERLLLNKKVIPIWNHVLKEVIGKENPKSVTGICIEDTSSKKTKNIPCDGVFIAIGHKPNTDIFRGMIDMDNEGYILTVPNSTRTNIEGVFAAGDVQDKIYRQAITAAGTGCIAALEAQKYLRDSL